MYILLLFIVMLASGYYLLLPFLRQSDSILPAFRFSSNGKQDLEYHKHLLLQEIKDIEFDYLTGKISGEDYQDLTREYKLRGAALLKQLNDGHESRHTSHNQKKVEVNFCSHCGAPVIAGANFCANCGTSLEGGQS